MKEDLGIVIMTEGQNVFYCTVKLPIISEEKEIITGEVAIDKVMSVVETGEESCTLWMTYNGYIHLACSRKEYNKRVSALMMQIGSKK